MCPNTLASAFINNSKITLIKGKQIVKDLCLFPKCNGIVCVGDATHNKTKLVKIDRTTILKISNKDLKGQINNKTPLFIKILLM